MQPFDLGVCSQRNTANDPPSVLLDPVLLSTASHAYLDALEALRTRSRTALQPGVRHSLATKILGFANFGERDRRALTERALAHFP